MKPLGRLLVVLGIVASLGVIFASLMPKPQTNHAPFPPLPDDARDLYGMTYDELTNKYGMDYGQVNPNNLAFQFVLDPKNPEHWTEKHDRMMKFRDYAKKTMIFRNYEGWPYFIIIDKDTNKVFCLVPVKRA
ncbi:MAG: hypothetical protein ACRC8S_02270 [Fimbriiglobus sp.]